MGQVKAKRVSGGQRAGLWCPEGSRGRPRGCQGTRGRLGPRIICKALQEILRVQQGQGGCLGVQSGSRGGPLGVLWGQEEFLGPSGWFDEILIYRRTRSLGGPLGPKF